MFDYIEGDAALYIWPRARWHTRDGKPVLNATLWQDLVRMVHRGASVPKGSVCISASLSTIPSRPDTTLYKCEVKSDDSPYFENVDDLVSDHYLKRGHIYDVRLNDDPKNPRIEQIFGEVDPTEPAT